jgi:chromosome segregation ATPase
MADDKQNLPQTLTLDHVSPATRLLEKRRQMFEVQEALDAQKEEFKRRENAFRGREEDLRKKDLELQESLIKFNKFLQENESKRNRAVKRAADEKKLREIKEVEIAKLKTQLDENGSQTKKLKETVEQNMKYTRYLEMVQESVQEDYPEISDLLNRYKTLKDANEDLSERQQSHEKEHEKCRVKFATFAKERTNEILNFNNEIASLQKSLEVGEVNAHQLQTDVDATIRSTSDKTLELGQILMAVENLLARSIAKHGQILKHTETRLSDKEQPGSGGHAKSGADSQASNNSDSEIAANSQKALADLDVIASYMVDFKAIVDARAEEKRAAKKGTNTVTVQ